MSITSKQIEQFITNLKAIGIIAKPNDVISALGKVYASKDCQSYDAASVHNIIDILRTEILLIYRNSEWLTENNYTDELEEVLKSLADACFFEEYMGINIARVLIDLSDTPFASTVIKLKALVDALVVDGNVVDSYIEMTNFIPEEGLVADDDETQRAENDLEFNYRCALLDALKDGLGIPQEIVEDPYDTHTVCYDAINEYDENLLIDKDTQNMLEDMASEKNDLDIDGFIESAEMFKNGGYIDEIDGDSITWSRDLNSAVAAVIYQNELERLDNV